MNCFRVAVGSALGGMARYGCSGLAARLWGETFRWGTLIVNVPGSRHLAGTTVLRGPMGFGRSSVLHTAKILRLSEDLPFVVEIVDSEDKIRAFLPELDALMGSGQVTLEKVQVIQYGRNDETEPPS